MLGSNRYLAYNIFLLYSKELKLPFRAYNINIIKENK